MDNTKVRSYLRKGELAAALLETLGYRYEEKSYAVPKWIEPANFVDMEQARKEMQAVLDKFRKPEPKPVCPVQVGDHFRILSLPAGHFLRAYGSAYGATHTVVETRFIKERTDESDRLKGFSGWTLSFDVPVSTRKQRVWLPLDCIKVTADARF